MNTYNNNSYHLQGRISAINEYSPGKACNISLAIDNGKDEKGNTREPSYIQTKSFTPKTYNELKNGMLIGIYGHIVPNTYTNKEGTKVFALDLVADYIDFLESKATVTRRESMKNLIDDEE